MSVSSGYQTPHSRSPISGSSPFDSPLSASPSPSSSRASMFEDAPNSPDSWRCDISANEVESPVKKSLEARLQDCTLGSPQPVKTTQIKLSKSPANRFPMLPATPLEAKTKERKIVPKPPKKRILLRSLSQRNPLLSRAASCQVGHPRIESANTVKRSVSTSAALRVPLGAQSLSRMPSTNLKSGSIADKLKIKVRCPDEDDILAIKIHKDKLQSVRELADVVSIKLNVRYCMRPDDLDCRLVFPDKSLPPVELGSDDVSAILEEFILEYIQTRSKIYIEARLKANRASHRNRMGARAGL